MLKFAGAWGVCGPRGFIPQNRIGAARGEQDWLRHDAFLKRMCDDWWGRFHHYDLKGPPSLVTKVFLLFLGLLGGPCRRPPLLHHDSHKVAYFTFETSPQEIGGCYPPRRDK